MCKDGAPWNEAPDIYVQRNIMKLGPSRWLSGKESTCQCRRHLWCGFSPWVRKIPWRSHGYPLQCSCLESPMDRGAWRATVRKVAQSRTQLSNWAHTWGWFRSCGRQQTKIILLLLQKQTAAPRLRKRSWGFPDKKRQQTGRKKCLPSCSLRVSLSLAPTIGKAGQLARILYSQASPMFMFLLCIFKCHCFGLLQTQTPLISS